MDKELYLEIQKHTNVVFCTTKVDEYMFHGSVPEREIRRKTTEQAIERIVRLILEKGCYNFDELLVEGSTTREFRYSIAIMTNMGLLGEYASQLDQASKSGFDKAVDIVKWFQFGYFGGRSMPDQIMVTAIDDILQALKKVNTQVRGLDDDK